MGKADCIMLPTHAYAYSGRFGLLFGLIGLAAAAIWWTFWTLFFLHERKRSATWQGQVLATPLGVLYFALAGYAFSIWGQGY